MIRLKGLRRADGKPIAYNGVLYMRSKGVASDTLLLRLNKSEEQKKAFEEQIEKEKATSPLFTKEQFKSESSNLEQCDQTFRNE